MMLEMYRKLFLLAVVVGCFPSRSDNEGSSGAIWNAAVFTSGEF